jgi:hypothetical protein
LHALAEVCFKRLKEQMEVIRHKAVGKQTQLKLRGCFSEELKERLKISLIEKDRLLSCSPVKQMVEGSFKL